MRHALSLFLALFASTATAFAQESGSDQPLQRIAFGSCNHDDKPQPHWNAIAQAKPRSSKLRRDVEKLGGIA